MVLPANSPDGLPSRNDGAIKSGRRPASLTAHGRVGCGMMPRPTFLPWTAAPGRTGALAAPAISQRAGARALRLVPHADLANFDPIWTTAYIARNAGLLVWDMLYGMDAKLQPQRQMVESESVSSDGLTWTFRLRGGLKFHDGEPVL